MSLTKEEMLELAKKCGAKVVYEGAQHTIFFESQLDLSAYTSALEQKYQAQNAMLHERDKYYGAPCEYFDDHTKTWIPARFIALAFSKVDREPLVQAERRMPIFGTWNSVRGLDEKGIKAAYALFEKSLSATQATSDAFIAEVKAGAREEDAKRIERAGQHISWHHAAKDWPTDARTAIEIFSANMAAELRNQQPEQPRKPCSCDGRCDGFCLEKEGKRK